MIKVLCSSWKSFGQSPEEWNLCSVMTDTTPLIRFAHPMAFQAFLRHIGAPVGSYLRRAGLPALCEEADV
jgi:hypothetical protein